jgi:hypothetical protein
VAIETTAKEFNFVKSNFWFFVSAMIGSFFLRFI